MGGGECLGMSENLEEILVNSCANAGPFMELITKHQHSKGTLDIGEAVESFSSETRVKILESLEKLLQESIVDLNSNFKNVYAAAVFIGLYMDKKLESLSLLKCMFLIHDNLLMFSDENIFVQNYCCELIERWWVENLEKREKLAVFVPTYLLARALCPIGKHKDVSRLNNVKEMLSLINFGSPESASLISLLCNATSDKLFLSAKEGVEFLSYVITLDDDLMLLIDQTLKCTIPNLKDRQLLKVGQIYKLGLENASSKDLGETFKKECIQKLIVCGLHCHRIGPYKAAPQVQKVLSVLHKNKQLREQNVLYELYLPLIWRALDAPNGYVRANATALLLDVFPLIPSTFTKVEFQNTLAERCTKIQELLKDDHEEVRVCAVRGVAHVLNKHWEMLPAYNLKTLLTTLCCDMTHDMSSNDVIVAALLGIQLLLNNPLAHVALTKLVNGLSNHIYHPSLAVRSTFVSMLQTLHQTHHLKFWDIVPADDMLVVLGNTKSDAMCKKIVGLVSDLYFPVSEPLSTQVAVVLSKLCPHPGVHRCFYQYVYVHVGLSASLKLAVALLRIVSECVDKGKVEIDEEAGMELDLENTELIGQMLEIAALLVVAAHKDLSTNAAASKKLCGKIAHIPKLLSHFGSSAVCVDALCILINHLPREGLISLKKQCFKLVRNKTSSLSVITSSCLALVKMGGANKIISYLSDNITTKLTSIFQSSVTAPDIPLQADSWCKRDDVYLEVVELLLGSAEKDTILSCTHIDTLYCTLLTSTDILPQHQQPNILNLRLDHNQYLVKCLALAARFSIHVGGAEDLLNITKCVYEIVVNTKPANNIRSSLLEDVYPALIEGFLVLQHNPKLLHNLHSLLVTLTPPEMTSQRVSICKYLYKAGHFLGKQGDEDVKSVLMGLLEQVSTSCERPRELSDIQSLLIEVVITGEKHSLVNAVHQPWAGVVVDLVEVVRTVLEGDGEDPDSPESEEQPLTKQDLNSFLQIILDSVSKSDTFGSAFIRTLSESKGSGDSSKFRKFVELVEVTCVPQVLL